VAGLLLGGIFVDIALSWVLGVGSSVAEAGAVGVGVDLGGLGHLSLMMLARIETDFGVIK
jgi:hypothetical protein